MLWTSKWVSSSAYEGSPLKGGLKCKALVEKLSGPQSGVCLWEVCADWRCPLARAEV